MKVKNWLFEEVLGIKPRASYTPGKCSTTELELQLNFLIFTSVFYLFIYILAAQGFDLSVLLLLEALHQTKYILFF
jgi:hypothetical protein